ncbi:kinase-like domain-containing protein [Roridomyces roridus]|uniref:non-specific serine/threonine protein kinase n=1 Tax=Roridomyces roridus TaxID=1738132 RepID=A0AAD7FW03_9AGAR|nr:kinase-like domain-containing protein [Roridomyces roridus]
MRSWSSETMHIEHHFTFTGPEILIGREGWDFGATQVNDPRVSAKHAILQGEHAVDGSKLVKIVDNNSSNGVWVDKTKLTPGVPRQLVHGCTISLCNPNLDGICFTYLADRPITPVMNEYILADAKLCKGASEVVYKALDKLKVEGQGGCSQAYQRDIVLEYADRGNLNDFIQSHNGLSERMAKALMRQLYEALAFTHRHGIAHRDLNTQKSFLANNTGANEPPILLQVTDFGLGKLFSDDTPDQADDPPIHKAADVLASGLVMYSCLTNRWSFPLDIHDLAWRQLFNGEGLRADAEGYPFHTLPAASFLPCVRLEILL